MFRGEKIPFSGERVIKIITRTVNDNKRVEDLYVEFLSKTVVHTVYPAVKFQRGVKMLCVQVLFCMKIKHMLE